MPLPSLGGLTNSAKAMFSGLGERAGNGLDSVMQKGIGAGLGGLDYVANNPLKSIGAGAVGGAAGAGTAYGVKKIFDHRKLMPAAPQMPTVQPQQSMDWSSLLRQGANYAALPTMIGAGVGGLGGLLGGGGMGGTLGGAAQGATTGLGVAGGAMGGSALAGQMGIQDPTAKMLFGLGGGALGGYLGNRLGGVLNPRRPSYE